MTRIGLTTIILATSLFVAACEDPAKGKPKAQVEQSITAPSPSVTAAPPVPIPTETVPFGPGESKVAFVGSKVTGSHSGGFAQFDGKLEIGPSPDKSRVSLTITMASLTSDAEKLTGHLKSPDFFDVEKYPTATFATTTIASGGTSGATHTLTGKLNLHGVEKTISFPATIRVTADRIEADSEFALNRKDFGITYPGMKDDLIRDEVVLKLTIRAPRTPNR